MEVKEELNFFKFLSIERFIVSLESKARAMRAARIFCASLFSAFFARRRLRECVECVGLVIL